MLNSSSKLAELKAAVTDTVHQGFDSLHAQVTHLANICSQLADGARSQHGTSMPVSSNASSAYSGTKSTQPGNIDRSRNIVIFGIEDSRDNVWRDTVLEALRTADGKDVMMSKNFSFCFQLQCKGVQDSEKAVCYLRIRTKGAWQCTGNVKSWEL